MFFLVFLTFRLNDKVNNDELLKLLKEDKHVDWVAGENERFRGITFGDAKILSDGAKRLRPETIPLAKPKDINVSIPMEYNFTNRYKQCDFGVLDQGKCGSCWAFSVVKSYSHRYCRKYGKKTLFSQSHLVACDRRNSGCQGGLPVSAWRYVDIKGLPLDECQPYDINNTSFDTCSRKCVNESIPFEVKKTEYWSVARIASIPEMQLSIMTEGPVTACMKVYGDFLYYRNGVYSHVKGEMLGHHAVEITGWGTSGGVDYWIVSNTWNSTWGENGLFRIKRGTNECGIEDYVCAGVVI